jgi:hypothetical protein
MPRRPIPVLLPLIIATAGVLGACASTADPPSSAPTAMAAKRAAPIRCLHHIGSRIERSACQPVNDQTLLLEDIEYPSPVEHRMRRVPVARIP